MKRLRLPLHDLAPGRRRLGDADARYVTRVHRLQPGDVLELFDPSARTRAEARLLAVDAGQVELEIAELQAGGVIAERSVRVVQGMPKGDKLDAIVRDATELGASEVWLCQSERAISKLDAERAPHKLQRLERIAEQAARQSGRNDVPLILPPRPLLACLQDDNADCKLLFTPSAEARVSTRLRALAANASVSFYVGPEGGFSAAECEQAEALGVAQVNLGAFVLRTETVVAAVLGALRVLEV